MEEIYEKYASSIYKYIYTLTNNNDITEEILQDTFYSAFKNIKTFKNDSSIYTWLCMIAKNKWRDCLRRKNKIKFVSLEENLVDTISLEEEFEIRNDAIQVYKNIHKLDSTIKEVLLLRLHADLTFKDIGKIFGKSEQWAKTTFYRGKLKVREEFKNE